MARRLADIESHIGSRDEHDSQRALRETVEQLSERVDHLARRKGDPATAQALREIEAQLVRLSEKQDAAAKGRPAPAAGQEAAGGEHLSRIEDKLNRLISSLSEPSEVVFPAGRAAVPSANQDAVAEILMRQKMLDRSAPPVARPLPSARDALTAPVFAGPQGATALDPHALQSGSAMRPRKDAVAHPDLEFLRFQVAEIADGVRGLAQREPPVALEQAIQDLMRRIDSSRQSGVGTDALAALEQSLQDVRRSYEAVNPKMIAEAMQDELRRLHDRIDAMTLDGFDRNAFLSLKQKTDEIGRLLAQLLARPISTDALERQVAALTERVDLLATRPEVSPYLIETLSAIRDSIDRVDSNPALRDIEHRVAELAVRSGELPPALFDILTDMRQAIDGVAANPALRAVQKQVTDLAARSGDLPASLIEVLADLQRSIENVSANPGLRALEQQVSSLAAHSGRMPEQLVDMLHEIRTSIDRMAGNAGVSAIEARVRDSAVGGVDLPDQFGETLEMMRHSIERMSLQPGLKTIEAQVADLARKVESALASPPSGVEADKIFERISDLHDVLISRIDNRPADQVRPDVEDRIAVLSERVDEVHRAIVEQVKSPDDKDGRLRDMIAQLADRIEKVSSGNGDTRALQALENQVTRLAERLEGAGETAESISALERAMGELFAQLEETRHAAIDAAETAAREAVRGAGIGGAAPEAVVREISELRTLQDESDRRTHSTLTAVHETLEKVVDRLVLLEDDLGEVRTQRDAAPETRKPARAESAASSVVDPVAHAPATASAPSPEGQEDAAAASSAPRFDARAAMQGAGRTPVDPVAAAPEIDVLIEPGSGFAPNRRGADQNHGEPSLAVGEEPRAAQASFIAAARRAAHSATPEQSRSASSASPGDAILDEARARARAAASTLEKSKIASAGGALRSRARPILLSIAGLFLLVSALQVARTMMDDTPGDPVVVDALPKLSSTAIAPRPVASLDAPAIIAPAPPEARAAVADAAPKIEAPAVTDPVTTASIPKTPASSATLVELANAGNVAAQFELGSRYADGREMKRDPAVAAEWFRKAAAKNHAPSQYRLGALYEKGVGVERSSVEAANWYRRAADAGNIRAMHNLAVLMAEGAGGKPDYAKAANWFRNAAEHGVRDSQYNLAILYARGLGVTKDLVKSYMWFALAAAQGDVDAQKKRDEIAAILVPRQLAEAKVAADTFETKSSNADANESASIDGLLAAPQAQTKPSAASRPSAAAPKTGAPSGKTTARVSSL